MKRLYLVFGMLLSACSTQDASPTSSDSVLRLAQYDSFPAGLFDAAAATCSKPFETLIRPTKRALRCEALPPPQVMAQIILAYDGYVEDLPRYVLDFEATPNAAGYLAAIDFYLDVPQRTGGPKHIKFRDSGVQKNLDRLLKVSGGRLINDTP